MKKVIFVDDDQNIILALKRMLRPLRNEWQMDFVTSGAEALQLLENDQYDAIVADMRMPEMDGVQLLSEVMDKYPHMVRIIFSGYSEQELILKSVRPTHQFISKPCDAEKMINIIQRTCDLHDLLSNEKIKQVISQIDSLPSLPALYNAIINKLKDPDAPIKEIAEIISKDVGMTSKILKLVNSSFFGFFEKITNPAQAVSLLGLNTVKTLILSLEIFSIFNPDDDVKFSFSGLWEHSTLTGVFCKEIAKEISEKPQFIEDAFLVGFLHDVGILTLAAKLPSDYKIVLQKARTENIPLWEAEIEVFGTSHAEVGAYLLGLWGFADHIVDAIARHHNPIVYKDEPLSILTIIHFADALSRKLVDSKQNITLSKLDENYLKELELLERGRTWIKICKKIYDAGDY